MSCQPQAPVPAVGDDGDVTLSQCGWTLIGGTLNQKLPGILLDESFRILPVSFLGDPGPKKKKKDKCVTFHLPS